MVKSRAVAVAVLTVVAVLGSASCSSSDDARPKPGPSSTSSPGSSPTADAGTGTEVSFVVDGTTTYGTLEVPAHPRGQYLAAALLLPGSGPTDRDGNDAAAGLTPSTLEIIADALADQGIITFRFDKYYTGRTGAGQYAGDPGAATIQGDLRQAEAAYAFLARQPAADPSRLLVVGHSEGGLLALDVATEAAKKPAGLALLEPQDERALDLVKIQTVEAIDTFTRQGQLTADQAQQNKAALTQAVAAFRAGQPVSTAGMAPSVAQIVAPLLLSALNAQYVRTWDQVVPAELATRVAPGTRVLVTDGTRDTNVPTSTIAPLVAALTSAGTVGPGLQVVPDADHLMHLSSQPDGDAVLAPAVLAAIEQWAQPYATTS